MPAPVSQRLTSENPRCPDFSSHDQNAFDAVCERMGIAPEAPKSDEFWTAQMAEFDAEFLHCEGQH